MLKNTVGRSQKQKIKLGFQRYDVIAKSMIETLLLQVIKIVKIFQSLTLFTPKSNNGLVHVRIAVENGVGEVEGVYYFLWMPSFLVEAII